MSANQENSTNKHSKLVAWLKRIGIIGFLFFLIKGLIWLAVFYFIGTNI